MKENKTYGLFRNFKYIFANIYSFNPKIFWILGANILFSSMAQLLPVFMPKLIIEEITIKGSQWGLISLTVAFGLLTALSNSVKSSTYINLATHFESLRQFMNLKVSKKYMSMAYENLENPKLIDTFEQGKWAFDDYKRGIVALMHRFRQISNNVIVIALTSVVLLLFNPLFVIVTANLILINFLVNNKMRKYETETNQSLLRNSRLRWNFVSQMIDTAYAKDIRLYTMQKFFLSKLKKEQDIRFVADKRINKVTMYGGFLIALTSMVQELALYLLVCGAVIAGTITIAEFTMYISALRTFVTALNSVLDDISFSRQQSEYISFHRRFMDWEDEEKKGAAVDAENMVRTDIEFRNVSFQYPNSNQKVLNDISLKMNSGEKLAIVGLNGAGKSTLVKLLVRLYEPSEGSIYLNGEDISKYQREEYYKLFSAVFQDVHMFAFSVGENVAMESYNEVDRERVKHALMSCDMWDKVESLPKGMDTPMLKNIETDGVDLSGGQIQKLAMARALYKNAPILIMDEPTAALDPIAEENLFNEISALSKGKTTLFISHRLSSTRFCDRIVVMENGRIVEEGTHQELLAASGRYHELYQMQAKNYKE